MIPSFGRSKIPIIAKLNPRDFMAYGVDGIKDGRFMVFCRGDPKREFYNPHDAMNYVGDIIIGGGNVDCDVYFGFNVRTKKEGSKYLSLIQCLSMEPVGIGISGTYGLWPEGEHPLLAGCEDCI